MMEADDETGPAAVATAGPSSSGPSSTPSWELSNAQKGQLYQVLRALFLERGVSSVQLAEVVQAYNEKTRQQCTAEAVDKVSMLRCAHFVSCCLGSDGIDPANIVLDLQRALAGQHQSAVAVEYRVCKVYDAGL